ncbi:MAG: hypothetical protein QXT91_00715 [Candidatus Caldarchaeum sp.]
MERKFDPRPHLIKIKSRGQEADYLPVSKRILWLRTEFPEAEVIVDLVHYGKDFAVVKARVELPNGAIAEDYGSETKEEFHDFVEKACTKAIGRALAQLGFGTQFAPELDLTDENGEQHVVDTPIVRRGAGKSYGSSH